MSAPGKAGAILTVYQAGVEFIDANNGGAGLAAGGQVVNY